ncbi:lipase maturation factor 1-like [Ostrea edulis]|uniref:lipase maturation factor 1-like n=1 Tax=Ostrea edulis TaxID=37623 RepID=UPI0024AF50F0|nr:lipase maturation factor 1-like [Ostrea edulis]
MAGDEAGLRKRKRSNVEISSPEKDPKETEKENDKEKGRPLKTNTYWLTRVVLLRYIGFIYFVAFLVAFHQNKELCGRHGLIPAQKFLKRIHQETKGVNMETFTRVPSLIWLIDYKKNLDKFLDYTAYVGLALSVVVVVVGSANCFIMLSLWALYHSIVNVGSTWYGFGWESQILETGFLATFLCPVWNIHPIPRNTPTSKVVIWGYRWLIFRIMIGAGLIKIRGDQCWRDLTCMNYHYETQPVPNPISYYMHQSPEIFHKFETLTNHFVELVAPWFLIGPRRLCMIGGGIQIFFQVVLIISGNLSFLNWLTIVPSLACFDDASLSWMFSNKPNSIRDQVYDLQHKEPPTLKVGSYIRRVFNISLGCLIAYLSIPVIQNLLSPRQAMNTSFDPLRLVNTYGAFGSVTKERTEVIFQGTYDKPHEPSARWEEYHFKCKPGNITSRPCLISPYHYRLDWLLWFAAFQNYQYNPWLVHLAVKLMSNDPGAESLIAHNPFHNRDPPKYIRVEHYRYVFTKMGSKDAKLGRWWKRRHIGNYLPPISLDSVKDFMKNMDYEYPRIRRRRKL